MLVQYAEQLEGPIPVKVGVNGFIVLNAPFGQFGDSSIWVSITFI